MPGQQNIVSDAVRLLFHETGSASCIAPRAFDHRAGGTTFPSVVGPTNPRFSSRGMPDKHQRRAGFSSRAAAPSNSAAPPFCDKRQNFGLRARIKAMAALGDLTPLQGPCTARRAANACSLIIPNSSISDISK